jgi:hypothetical protein
MRPMHRMDSTRCTPKFQQHESGPVHTPLLTARSDSFGSQQLQQLRAQEYGRISVIAHRSMHVSLSATKVTGL